MGMAAIFLQLYVLGCNAGFLQCFAAVAVSSDHEFHRLAKQYAADFSTIHRHERPVRLYLIQVVQVRQVRRVTIALPMVSWLQE